MADACLKVDWNSLPVERDPSKTEYKSYTPGYCDYDYYDYGNYGSKSRWNKSKQITSIYRKIKLTNKYLTIFLKIL